MIVICEICRMAPCDPRCPNAPEPVEVYECDECGCGIREGEYVFKLGDQVYCEECIRNSREEVELVSYEFE